MASATHSTAPLPPLVRAADYAGASSSAARTLVEGQLRYMHYSCDGFCDNGWGCGLRTVQTILSWLNPDLPPPSIPEMQAILGHAAGSTSWIGVQEAVVLLDELYDATVEVLPLSSGRELESNLPRLATHLASGGGPLMIGGTTDVYCKTIIGVDQERSALLILDPHYVGGAVHARDVESLRAAGWAAWKPLFAALNDGSCYNVALPRRPPQPAAGGPKMKPPRAVNSAVADARPGNRPEVPAPDNGKASWEFEFEVVEEGCEG